MKQEDIIDIRFLYSPEHPEHILEVLKHGDEKYRGRTPMRIQFTRYGRTFATVDKEYVPTINYSRDHKQLVAIEVVDGNFEKALDDIFKMFSPMTFEELVK